jgi:hypothetical protein
VIHRRYKNRATNAALPATPRHARPRPWAHRVAVSNPSNGPNELEQVARDLPAVVERLRALGYVPEPISLSRRPLTMLQMQLKDATLDSDAVAQDPIIQSFRKLLHLLLDH